MKALEHYEDIADIKRAVVHTSSLPIDVRLPFLQKDDSYI